MHISPIKKQLTFFAISIFLHSLAILGTTFFNHLFFNKGLLDDNSRDTLEIERISAEEIEKLRTVGIKNGKKDFSTKVKELENRGQLSLASLGATASLPTEVKVVEKSRERDTNLPVKFSARKSGPSPNVLEKLAISERDKSILHKAGINIQLEPPEGVSEDMLNSTEKIFYGFQKRAFTSYAMSFLTSYKKMVRERPYVEANLFKEKSILSGKITFNRDGNRIAVKIIQWADNDDLQLLFENTLKGIHNLHNPPKALIKNSDEFHLYYQLRVNQ